MTGRDNELERYAGKPLSERMQAGMSLDKNPNINVACMMEPVLLLGFSHPPDEDHVRKIVEKRVKRLRSAIRRDLIQDDVRKDAADASRVVDRVTGRDPVQHAADRLAKSVARMLGGVAGGTRTRCDEEGLEAAARAVVRLAGRDTSKEDMRGAAGGVARELVRLAGGNVPGDEARETADGVARELVRLAGGMTGEGVREASDRVERGLERLAGERAAFGGFWIMVYPCVNRLARLAGPNVAGKLNAEAVMTVSDRLAALILTYLTDDELDVIYPAWARVEERNLTMDTVKERADKVVRKILDIAGRRPGESDARAEIDGAAKELASHASGRYLSKDDVERLADGVERRLAACATDKRLTGDGLKGIADGVVRELMRAIAKQDDIIEKERRRWRGDVAAHHVDRPYFEGRSKSWQVRRLINAHAVGKTNLHKQIVELFKPVMIDLLDGRAPTLKGLKDIAGGRQARRTFGRHSAILQRRGQDTDGRVRQFGTIYGESWNGHMPMIERGLRGRTYFDMREFADAAYVKRQRRFWEDTLKILSEWLHSKQEAGGGMTVKNRWLIHHIVNNDIGLHVLFYNISLKCELHHLSDATKRKIVYNYKKEIPESELDSIVEMAREEYKNDAGPEKWGYIYRAKSGNGVAVYMEAGDDGPHVTGVQIIPTPYRYNKEDAVEAVKELKKFAAGFSDIVARFDGLGSYKIPQCKIEWRIGELVREAALALKSNPDGSPRELEEEDAWAWICEAWCRTRLCKRNERNPPD